MYAYQGLTEKSLKAWLHVPNFPADAATDAREKLFVSQNSGIGTKTNMLVFSPMRVFTGLRWLVEYNWILQRIKFLNYNGN